VIPVGPPPTDTAAIGSEFAARGADVGLAVAALRHPDPRSHRWPGSHRRCPADPGGRVDATPPRSRLWAMLLRLPMPPRTVPTAPFPPSAEMPAAFPPLETSEFAGAGVTTPPTYDPAGIQPAGDPFLNDVPDEEDVTFPIGAAKDAVRRARPKKMSWSVKNLTFWQKMGCLVGALCNLVIAPLLIYLIYTQLSSDSTPPTPTKPAVRRPQPLAPPPQKTDPDRLPE